MSKMKELWCCNYCIYYICNRCTLHDVTVEDKHTNVCDNYECKYSKFTLNHELKGE